MPKLPTLFTALFLVAGTLATAQPQADIYVSPSGNDDWSGRLPAPSADHKDGPFATIARAQRAVREMRGAKAITVQIRAGTYYLPQPLTFSEQDSGTPERPVTYAAYPNESPVISGGVRLKAWHLDKSGRWQTTIPEVTKGEWDFLQLFVNGQRRYRPRLPRRGFYHIAQRIRTNQQSREHGFDRFGFVAGEIKPEWKGTDAEVLVFHSWAMSRMHIASVDETSHVVTFTGPSFREYHDMRRGDRYIVENVPEALEGPGEWYLDRHIGVLTYIPKNGESLESAEIIAPKLEKLLVLNGAHNIRFQGITFAHTNWNAPASGYSYAQSDIGIPAAIEAVNSRHIEFLRSRVQHTGGYAIAFGAGAKNNRVELCELIDLGAGGIKIGEISPAILRNEEADPNRAEESVASHNIVHETNIEGGGRIQPAGVGVWIGHSPFNEVSHTRIHDFYSTGISVGWTWGYKPSLAHNNRIEDNQIFKIGQGVLSDVAGIYTLGVSPGSTVQHNLIHDVQAYSNGGRGIDLDEGSSSILVRDNIVYNTSHEAFMLDSGRDNEVVNNIFALSRNDLIGAYKKTDGLSLLFERNILYWTHGRLMREPWQAQSRIDHNLLWNPNGDIPEFGEDSVIADPLFVSPDTGDFRLKEDSPAVRIGFKPISMDGMGLTVKLGRRTALERAY